jgi:hypothetical protein
MLISRKPNPLRSISSNRMLSSPRPSADRDELSDATF